MSAVYLVDGKPHRICDCDTMSQACPRGRKRELQTCGFSQCLVPAPDVLVASAQSESASRDAVIEEVAKAMESASLTYAGPDPQGMLDLKFLTVAAIRDMKGKP